jgi:hypothetical protein
MFADLSCGRAPTSAQWPLVIFNIVLALDFAWRSK